MGGETMVVNVWECVPELVRRRAYTCTVYLIATNNSGPIPSFTYYYLVARLVMAPKVLVVCLGNICRSPMGEAVLRHIAKERNVDLIVDSAGTAAYHVGEEPDER